MRNLILTAMVITLLSSSSCEKGDCQPTDPKPDCICTMDYSPVCGCDGKTYSNACSAGCHGIKEYTPGECP